MGGIQRQLKFEELKSLNPAGTTFTKTQKVVSLHKNILHFSLNGTEFIDFIPI